MTFMCKVLFSVDNYEEKRLSEKCYCQTHLTSYLRREGDAVLRAECINCSQMFSDRCIGWV